MRGAERLRIKTGARRGGGEMAAKWSCSSVDHPRLEEFIWCKAYEERKARV